MELNERQIMILRQFLLTMDPVNTNLLSESLHCSIKTIQRDLKKIEEIGKDVGFSLIRINGHGIVLECNPVVLNKLREIVFGSDKLIANDSVNDRRNKIYFDLLLTSPKPTSIRTLSEKYYVSSSSIVNDLAEIEQWANASGIEMKKTRDGTYLQGNELSLRNEAVNMISEFQKETFSLSQNVHGRLNEETRMILVGIYGEANLAYVEECVSEIEDAIDVMLSEVYTVNIITHILIAMERMKNNRFIKEKGMFVGEKCNEQIFHKIKHCVSSFSEKCGIKFPNDEIVYIYTHFMGCGVGELPSRQVIAQTLQATNVEVLAFCNELIERMEHETGMLFTNDSNLFYSLLLHVNSMITRIKYNVRIVNVLKEKTKKDYQNMFMIVKKVAIELKDKYYPEYFISDDELCYLCFYFQLALEDKSMPCHVLLVCSTGVGTSHILKKRVKDNFPKLKIEDVISSRQLQNRDLSGIDLIITTVKLDFELRCKTAIVSVMLDQKDIEEIKGKLK